MKHLIVLVAAVLFVFTGFAQEDDDVDKFGANQLHFVHSHLSLGFMTPPTEGEGADLLYGKSHSITYGVRYKLQFVDFFALGAGLNYTYNVWHFKQEDNKIIPSNIQHDKEKLFSNNLGGDVFLRFNISQRTNRIGTFIDLGGFGEWAYGRSWKVMNEYDGDSDDPLAYDYGTSTLHKVNFMEKINYGLSTRIGYGKFVLFGKYRLSDIFTQEYKDGLNTETDLPRLLIGFEVGFHK